ncbi:hypothetical protein Peur_042947 [Populus x canadensis]
MQTLVSSFVQLNFILLYLLDFRFLLVNQHFALAIEVIAKLRCLYSLQHEEAVIRFLIVVLKKGKDETFQVWKSNVYSEAVNRINGRPPPKTGDFVLVADGTEKPIGWGLYNSVSMLCVRLMQLEEEATRTSVEILKEEGMNVSDVKEKHRSTCPERIKVMVNGITYVISLVCKKTEFYADQRENRQLISTISNGLKVLDICSHSGGFALNVVQ